MKYTKPSYEREVIASEDIMEFSPNNISTEETTFDYGDGKGAVDVTKGTSTANIKDLLF
ncbi:MAG: hypothetical protein IJ309_05755 [Clostridia bacterium]|nr:hypothetical protein [Clostridia bacterium]